MSLERIEYKGFCRICLKQSTIETHYPNEIYAKDRGYTTKNQIREFAIPCDICRRKMYKFDFFSSDFDSF